MSKTILCAIRVSTERQETESQKQEMLQFCLSLGYTEDNIEWIEVAGASARKLNSKYIQMLEDIKNKILSTPTIKAAAFWHLNRLGRVESKLMEMKEWFIANRIQVFIKNPSITLFENVELGKTSAGAEISWSVFATMVKFDTEELFEKVKRGKARNAKNKKFNGGTHIKTGYKVDENNYIVPDYDSSDYALVILIYNEFATGKYSTMSLAKELRARGIKKANGEWVSFHFIRNLIHDTSYIGYSDKYGCERTYDPIISKALWEKCQKVMEGNTQKQPKATKHHYFGIKLIKCPKCGYNFVAQAKVYRCFKHSNRAIYDYASEGKVCDNGACVGIHIMDGLLWRIAEMEHLEYLTDLKSENKEDYEKKIEILNQKISASNVLIEDTEKKKLRIQEGYIDGIYNKEVRDEKIAKVDTEVIAVKQTIVAYQEEIEGYIKVIEDLGKTDDYLERLADAMFTTDNITDEKQLYDIVHQHIKVVYMEHANFNDKKCVKITVELKRGEIEYFLYFPWVKKGHKIFNIHKDGKAVPYGYQNIIRDDSNSKDKGGIDKEYPSTMKTKEEIEQRLQYQKELYKMFPYFDPEYKKKQEERAAKLLHDITHFNGSISEDID